MINVHFKCIIIFIYINCILALLLNLCEHYKRKWLDYFNFLYHIISIFLKNQIQN